MSFLGFKILYFNILGFFRKMNIFWDMKILWIFLGVITKLDYILWIISMHFYLEVKVVSLGNIFFSCQNTGGHQRNYRNGINNKQQVNSSNGRHYGVIFFKPEKNLEFFRLKMTP